MLRYVAFKCCDRLVGACKCWANNVGICCAEMLLSFGRSLLMLGQQCWDMLRWDVAIVWPGLHATSTNVALKKMTIFKFEPTTHNTLQHVATRRNRVAKRAQRVAPNNIGICCDRLAEKCWERLWQPTTSFPGSLFFVENGMGLWYWNAWQEMRDRKLSAKTQMVH